MTRDRTACPGLDTGFAAGIAIILMLGGAALTLPDTEGQRSVQVDCTAVSSL